MEQNFQTSFIPKKPIIEKRTTSSRPVGIFMILSIFAFFSILIASGGLYFYKSVLQSTVIKMQSDLSLAQNRFEPSKITQLQVLDTRLKAATDILTKHIAISPIFAGLQGSTLKTVRYTKFTYTYTGDKNATVDVKMQGEAIGYRSIALQADLFTQNKFMIDPVFSNLALDDKGNVKFDLDFSIDPSYVDYEQELKTNTTPTTTTSTSTATVANSLPEATSTQ
jgi:hypothetical protein